MGKTVKALLFDSGRVLNRPAAENWFITPNFFNYVDRQTFDSIPKAKRDIAFRKAGEYISSKELIKTEEEEFLHFLQYYKILFNNLPEISIDNEETEQVARDLVYNYDKYVFYKDATEVIPGLSKSYLLAIVSDAWPSLENVFKKAGLRDYFKSFVISSAIGVRKPNELMYSTALKELGVSPGEAVFIDDNYKNCDGAKKIGIQSFVLCRDIRVYWFFKIFLRNHRVIRNLYDIDRYIQGS